MTIALDIDNDGQPSTDWDNSQNWTTIKQFMTNFAGYELWIVESKNHNRDKTKDSGTREARPKFHAYFPLPQECTDANRYQQMIQTIVQSYCRPDGVSRFDTNATDLARIYTGDYPQLGYQVTEDRVYYQSGKPVVDYVKQQSVVEVDNPQTVNPDSPTLSRFQVTSYQQGWRYQNLISKLGFEDIFEGVAKGNVTGNNWMRTFCPLHGEVQGSSNPSLNINLDTYQWKCWSGCSQGEVQDAIEFIAKTQHKSEVEIVEELCQNLGIRNKDVTLSHTADGSEYDAKVLWQLQQLNRKYAVLKQGSKVGIMYTDYDNLEQTSVPRLGMRPSDFKLLETKSVRHQNRKTKLANLWLEWEDRRTYQGLIFDPSGKDNPNHKDKWNLWHDWSTATPESNWQGDPNRSGFIKQLNLELYQQMKGLTDEELEQKCGHYLRLIRRVICGNQKKRVGYDDNGQPQYQPDEEKVDQLYHWILNWIADAFQYPAKHARVCGIVLRSKEGTGKGKFVNDTLGKLFRPHYFHLTGDTDKLTGKFNAWVRDNLLIFSDEAVWGGNRKEVGKMKSLITERERAVEQKFVDAIQYANHSRVICASNDSWVVHLTESDRRWQFIDVSEEFATENVRTQEQIDAKNQFFQSIDDEWNNGGRESFFELMMRREVDNYDFPKQRVITETYYEQLRESDPMVGWFEQCIGQGKISRLYELTTGTPIQLQEDGTEIKQTEYVYNSFKDYLKQTHQTRRWSGDFKEFSKRLKKLLNSGTDLGDGFSSRRKWEADKSSKTVWMLEPLSTLKEIYNQKAGGGDVLFPVDN